MSDVPHLSWWRYFPTSATVQLIKLPHVFAQTESRSGFRIARYLGFIQNILGRLQTRAITIVALFFATTIALSAYPFEPRQANRTIRIALFTFLGIAVVKVYVGMHRDATLSHVTNTWPGALDPEFWFKVVALGFVPLAGRLTWLIRNHFHLDSTQHFFIEIAVKINLGSHHAECQRYANGS